MTTITEEVRLQARRLANPCLHCGNEKPRGTGTRYCSVDCRNAAKVERERINRRSLAPCLHCNGPRTAGSDGRTKFCSDKCREDYTYVKAQASQRNRQDQHRAWRARTKHQRHGYYIMRTYGITAEEYDAILDEQGGVCAICGKRPVSKMFSVDHDHKTMRIRGLIHGSPCNQLLGNARDDIVRLQAAIKYLKEPPAYSVLSAERIVPTPRIRRYRSYIGAS